MKTKITMKEIKEKISADSYSRRGEVITIREQYFYTLGKTTQTIIDRVLKSYPKAEIVDSGNHYANFRGGDSVAQSSHWFVKFIIS